ncbi:MAG: hypothetical protein ABIH39_09135, partial [Candidatus Margulisiibacteriota bacterium]
QKTFNVARHESIVRDWSGKGIELIQYLSLLEEWCTWTYMGESFIERAFDTLRNWCRYTCAPQVHNPSLETLIRLSADNNYVISSAAMLSLQILYQWCITPEEGGYGADKIPEMVRKIILNEDAVDSLIRNIKDTKVL